jgi:alkanesulfonate monooxygenase SsuD/methylene tetrahydromethanopterin reductase-like flavin-dependent oxidoreductase (luciferase family)
MSVEHLQAEVERLRDLLEEHGIDPDYDPNAFRPPAYGPPTLLQMGLGYLTRQTASRMANDILRGNALMDRLRRRG